MGGISKPALQRELQSRPRGGEVEEVIVRQCMKKNWEPYSKTVINTHNLPHTSHSHTHTSKAHKQKHTTNT